MKFKEFKNIDNNEEKGFLEKYNEEAVNEIIENNKELYNSIKKNAELSSIISEIYKKIKNKFSYDKNQKNENNFDKKIENIALVLFSSFFIHGCTERVDGILEVPNIIEYYSKKDYYDKLARIKKACDGEESKNLVFCKQYKENGRNVIVSVDKNIWENVLFENDNIKKEAEKFTEIDKENFYKFLDIYQKFHFINEDEYENNFEKAEYHLGERGDCSTFAVTFYQKLVENGVSIDKINLTSGIVSYNNDGNENHIWITAKISKKIIMIFDNNGYGVLRKNKESDEVSIPDFHFNQGSGGGNGIANYIPKTIMKN